MRRLLLVLVLAAALGGADTPTRAQPIVREVAVTIDDLPTVSVVQQTADSRDKLTRDLLAAIRRQNVPAIGFVNEGKLYVDGKLDPRRVALLQQWIDAGLELGNHTYSHIDMHRASADEYQSDIARGEEITAPLMRKAGRVLRYFRHPYLHTGQEPEPRARVLAFLRMKGYQVAPVSIDNSDYVFAAAYDRVLDASGADAAGKVAAAYLDYMDTVVAYYEQQSRAIVGREIRQTLLLHANALNAQTFDDLVARYRQRGYRFITIERALEDEAYAQPDEYFGPGGITWLHRWALTQKKPSSIFAGEPDVPGWIAKAAASNR